MRRLRAAGAVIVGKTTTSEFGQWPFTEGPAFGITRNPWDLDHTPGRLVRRRGGRGRGRPRRRARSAPTAPARCGSRRRGPTSSASSPSAAASRPGRTPRRSRASPASARSRARSPTPRCCSDAVTGNRDGDLHRPPPPASRYPDAAARGAGTAPDRALDRDPVQRRAGEARPRGPRGDRADRRRARGARAHGRRGGPRLRPGRRELHAPLDERHPRVGRPRSPTPRCSTRAPATTRRSASSCRARCLPARELLERPLRARIGKIFKDFDVVLAPTTAQPAAADRRRRGPRRLGRPTS